MSRLAPLPRTTLTAGIEIVPPSLLIAFGHAWLGAAALGAVLAASAFQYRMAVRSAQQQHQATLSYAQDTATLGGDPGPVIAALQHSPYPAEADPAAAEPAGSPVGHSAPAPGAVQIRPGPAAPRVADPSAPIPTQVSVGGGRAVRY